MSRRIAEHTVTIVIMILLIFCFGSSLIAGRANNSRDDIYMLYHTQGTISAQQAVKNKNAEAMEEDSLDFTYWGTAYDQKVESDLGRRITNDLMYICGSSDLIFESGQSLMLGDYEGCLISGDIAWQLFGSRNVKGQTIYHEGKGYVVRAVLEQCENTIAVQAAPDTEGVLDTAALRIPTNKRASAVIELYSSRYGSGEAAVNTAAVGTFASAITWILPLFAAIGLLVPATGMIIQTRKTPVLCGIWIVGTAAVLFAYLWVQNFSFQVPDEWIPSSWSEFSFWKSLTETKSKELWAIILSSKREPERILLVSLFEACKYSTFSILLYMFFRYRTKQITFKTWYLYSILSILTVFIFVKMYAAQINNSNILRSLWLFVVSVLSIQGLYNWAFQKSQQLQLDSRRIEQRV